MEQHENYSRFPIFFLQFQMQGAFTAVLLVYKPFSQFGPQLELYSQLHMILWSDLIALGDPNSR